MAHVIEGLYIPPGCGPVWVANHYRAIADYVLVDTQGCWCAEFPRHVPVHNINQWLFAPEHVEHLVEEYLKPLRNQLSPEEKELHDAWLPHRSLRLSPEQALHERIMREIALEMQDTPLVLKGGTALALLYGLDRHSLDLDFDCGLAKRIRIKNRVRRGLREVDVPMSAFRRGLPHVEGTTIPCPLHQPCE